MNTTSKTPDLIIAKRDMKRWQMHTCLSYYIYFLEAIANLVVSYIIQILYTCTQLHTFKSVLNKIEKIELVT